MASIVRDGLDFDKIYPVGSIYMSASSTNPHDLFGGIWEQIQGRFLIGTGEVGSNSTNYWGTIKGGFNMPPGETGGEENHTLTVNEMPSHRHTGLDIDNVYIFGWDNGTKPGTDWMRQLNQGNSTANRITTGYTGGNGSHNNMPPYLAVYMWKRVG